MHSAPGSASMQVLVVTPDRAFANAAQEELPVHGDLEVTVAGMVEEALEIMSGETHFDCILSDHDLPDLDGIAFLEVVRAQSPSLPFILFTSKGTEEVASRAITAGVTEYLIKERHTEQWGKLAALVRDAVAYHRRHGDFVSIEERAETLLDNSFDAIWVVRDGISAYVNRTGIELLGLDGKGAVIGEPIVDWVETRSPPPIGDALDAVVAKRETLNHREGQLRRPDGQLIPVMLAASRVTWGEGPAVVLVVRDLRERKELEHDLKMKERAVDAAPIGVTIADVTRSETPLIYVNEKLMEMTGYQADDLLGRSFWSFMGGGRA